MFILKRIFVSLTKRKDLSEQEKYHLLQIYGFTGKEIERLQELRGIYLEQKKSQIVLSRRRLEFAHWPVITGKLTEQVF